MLYVCYRCGEIQLKKNHINSSDVLMLDVSKLELLIYSGQNQFVVVQSVIFQSFILQSIHVHVQSCDFSTPKQVIVMTLNRVAVCWNVSHYITCMTMITYSCYFY